MSRASTDHNARLADKKKVGRGAAAFALLILAHCAPAPAEAAADLPSHVRGHTQNCEFIGPPAPQSGPARGGEIGAEGEELRLVTYTVAPGDGLKRLARVFGITEDGIRRHNPDFHPRRLDVGDTLALALPEGARLEVGEGVKEIRRGLRGFRRVALTFDAGADLGALDRLIEVLRERQAVCSFFVTGRWAERHPEAFRRVLDDGHEIFNHSYTHRAFCELASEEIAAELERTEAAFQRIGGAGSRPFCRPPYGDRNRRVLEATARAGWRTIYWTLDSLDSVGKPKTVEEILCRVLGPPDREHSDELLDGAIILFHVSPKTTAEAVGEIIGRLRERGLEPVTLTRLLGIENWAPEPIPMDLVAETEWEKAAAEKKSGPAVAAVASERIASVIAPAPPLSAAEKRYAPTPNDFDPQPVMETTAPWPEDETISEGN